jgi:hypothetical protein
MSDRNLLRRIVSPDVDRRPAGGALGIPSNRGLALPLPDLPLGPSAMSLVIGYQGLHREGWSGLDENPGTAGEPFGRSSLEELLAMVTRGWRSGCPRGSAWLVPYYGRSRRMQ